MNILEQIISFISALKIAEYLQLHRASPLDPLPGSLPPAPVGGIAPRGTASRPPFVFAFPKLCLK